MEEQIKAFFMSAIISSHLRAIVRKVARSEIKGDENLSWILKENYTISHDTRIIYGGDPLPSTMTTCLLMSRKSVVVV